MPFELVLDPHTSSVIVRKARKCRTCKRYLVEDPNFYPGETSKCKKCYDRLWMKKNDRRALLPLELKIRFKVQRANARSRFRQSTGPELTTKEAIDAWTGFCFHCSEQLTFDWHPRKHNPNHAVIDRFDTSQNRSYGNGNFKWMCWACNDEKGPWDLVEQQNIKIKKLRSMLRAHRKKNASKMYSSILIGYCKRRKIS